MFRMIRLVLLLGSAAIATAAPAQTRDQESAYAARQKGMVMSLARIEAMVVPRIEASGATYLRSSPEYDEERVVYRLKFQRQYKIFWVEIDARSGREVARSGR